MTNWLDVMQQSQVVKFEFYLRIWYHCRHFQENMANPDKDSDFEKLRQLALQSDNKLVLPASHDNEPVVGPGFFAQQFLRSFGVAFTLKDKPVLANVGKIDGWLNAANQFYYQEMVAGELGQAEEYVGANVVLGLRIVDEFRLVHKALRRGQRVNAPGMDSAMGHLTPSWLMGAVDEELVQTGLVWAVFADGEKFVSADFLARYLGKGWERPGGEARHTIYDMLHGIFYRSQGERKLAVRDYVALAAALRGRITAEFMQVGPGKTQTELMLPPTPLLLLAAVRMDQEAALEVVEVAMEKYRMDVKDRRFAKWVVWALGEFCVQTLESVADYAKGGDDLRGREAALLASTLDVLFPSEYLSGAGLRLWYEHGLGRISLPVWLKSIEEGVSKFQDRAEQGFMVQGEVLSHQSEGLRREAAQTAKLFSRMAQRMKATLGTSQVEKWVYAAGAEEVFGNEAISSIPAAKLYQQAIATVVGYQQACGRGRFEINMEDRGARIVCDGGVMVEMWPCRQDGEVVMFPVRAWVDVGQDMGEMGWLARAVRVEVIDTEAVDDNLRLGVLANMQMLLARGIQKQYQGFGGDKK